jgi:protease I
MTKELVGRHVAVLAADGVDELELAQPRRAVEDAGATTELLSVNESAPCAVNPADASPDDYDALILSGGTTNPDAAAMDFVKAFVDSGKPVGVLSHGSPSLVEAGVLRGRTLVSSSRVDGHNPLPAFCREIVAQFAV